jgi:hypothetical protein
MAAHRGEQALSHEDFASALIASAPAVFAVGLWLHRKGYSVEIPGLRIAPSPAQYADYLDDGDLFVFVYWHYDVRHRYEVRHLPDTHFTSRRDWPFGNRIFVDRVAKVDRAGADVIAYVTVSDDLKAIAVIPRNTREHWRKIDVFNTRTNRMEDTYSCPLMYADFEVL